MRMKGFVVRPRVSKSSSVSLTLIRSLVALSLAMALPVAVGSSQSWAAEGKIERSGKFELKKITITFPDMEKSGIQDPVTTMFEIDDLKTEHRQVIDEFLAQQGLEIKPKLHQALACLVDASGKPSGKYMVVSVWDKTTRPSGVEIPKKILERHAYLNSLGARIGGDPKLNPREEPPADMDIAVAPENADPADAKTAAEAAAPATVDPAAAIAPEATTPVAPQLPAQKSSCRAKLEGLPKSATPEEAAEPQVRTVQPLETKAVKSSDTATPASTIVPPVKAILSPRVGRPPLTPRTPLTQKPSLAAAPSQAANPPEKATRASRIVQSVKAISSPRIGRPSAAPLKPAESPRLLKPINPSGVVVKPAPAQPAQTAGTSSPSEAQLQSK